MSEQHHDSQSERPRRFGFFRGIGRGITLLRNVVLNTLFLIVLIAILVAIFSDDAVKAVPDSAVLVLNPAGNLVEQETYDDPILDLLIGSNVPIETSINDVLNAIAYAAKDERIQLVVLDFSRLLDVDMAESERIQNALNELSGIGMEIWAHATTYTQGTYMLSMGADRVLMDPMGDLVFPGVSSSTMYYKDLLDKLNITVNVYAEGEFKTAVEPFIRNDMSDAAQTVNAGLVEALWSRMKERIASARNIDEVKFNEYATALHELVVESETGFADLAVEYGFVDALVTKAEVDDEYHERLSPSLRPIKFEDYLPHVPSRRQLGQPKIGVVVVQGDILGVQTQITGQSSSWVKQIEKIRKDATYRALVLRVVSPGGSVVASEDIRRALEEFKETERPLVASFGGTAASGGYWISLPADQIFATPTTLTGSVGVFGLYPNINDALSDIGVTNDVIRTTPYGLSSSLMVNPTDATHSLRSLTVKRYYDQFVGLVASARDKPVEYIEELAQGRVWLGSDALESGLIDELGEIEAAIAKAAELAGLDEYDVEYVQQNAGLLSPLDSLAEEVRMWFAEILLPLDSIGQQLTREIKYLRDPTNVYARCSGCKLHIQ
ncbi:MAG: signal peptide peptidase SppA [Gammaproteobacteria bacterium]|nr:signal peptide peptidase SppA [Gammaproteobacteria bacterium]